jgi:hypothetical protein
MIGHRQFMPRNATQLQLSESVALENAKPKGHATIFAQTPQTPEERQSKR